MNKFKEEIFRIVSRIPKGKTMAYKEVAKLAGRPMARGVESEQNQLSGANSGQIQGARSDVYLNGT